MTTKKTQIFDVLSIENGGFYNYLLLVVGIYIVNVHLCKKNHKDRVYQQKLLFLATTGLSFGPAIRIFADFF